MYDFVTVSVLPAAAIYSTLTSNDKRVPTDNRNTAWRMVRLALREFKCREVDVHIEKRLPVQGGLGAGSGNAVAALVGLRKIFRSCHYDEKRRLYREAIRAPARSVPMCPCF